MAAVINMRVAAGGGEVTHGPARGAARREKGGSWWQAARAQPPGGQASTHFPTINTQPCWPGRAGLGWAGLGRAGWPLSACVSPPARTACCYTASHGRPALSSATQSAAPGGVAPPPPPRPLLAPRPRSGGGELSRQPRPSARPPPGAGRGGEQVIVEKCDTAPHTALPAWPGTAHFHILNSQFYIEIGRKWIITVGPATVPNNHKTEG